MSDPDGSAEETDPRDVAVGEQLRDVRPLPRAAFRGALQRHLAANDPGYGPRPENLRLVVTAWVAAGAVLLLIGAMLAGGII
jgi:hypothetical protein